MLDHKLKTFEYFVLLLLLFPGVRERRGITLTKCQCYNATSHALPI